MVIRIDPKRINTPGGATLRERPAQTAPRDSVVVPKRANENFIPSPESLRTLVTGAVEALRRGIRWDRGTILNLLV
jgi:hypothetical protein